MSNFAIYILVTIEDIITYNKSYIMNRRNRHSIVSAVATIALLMAASPVSAQTKAQASQTGANFLSPLKAAARAASRNLWGYVNNANAWPTASHSYGYMSFNAATASDFSDLRAETDPDNKRSMSPNGGSSYYNGKYNFIHFQQNSSKQLVVTYYQLNTDKNWGSVYAPETVDNASLIAVSTATSQLTGKVYGQFYTSDMASFEFGVIDYDQMDRTTIAASQHKFVAMGVSSEERVYAVATDGNLYEIDTTTGEEKQIGPTGVYVAPSSEKSWTQSGEIDQDDDTFYWASFDANNHGALYTVDLQTGLATLIADFAHNEQVLGLAIPEATPADGAPAAATNLSFAFDGASTSGTVSFTSPSKTYGGQTLSGELTYTIRSGRNEILTGKVAPNSSVSQKINAPEGMNYFSLTLANAEGKSKATTASAFVGYDQPRQVSFARLKIDKSTGKATVTWGVPSGTVNGGYLGTLKYDIVRYPDAKTIAEGVSGTSFTETIKDKQLRNYYYGVIPVNGTKRGAERRTAAVSYGDNIVPPYTEDFSNESAFDLFTVIDLNEDGKTWAWDEEEHNAYYSASTKTAKDWLITPPIQLQANHSYAVSFTARKSSAMFKERIMAYWGNQPTDAALTNKFLGVTELTTTGDTFKGEIRATSKQILYFGIYANSNADMGRIIVDGFSIVDNGDLNAPAAVENLEITPDPTAALKSTISFRLPQKTVGGDNLSAITKVVVTRDGATVKEFGASKAGETLTCVDNSPVAGFNNYTITAYTSAGAGTPTTAKAYVGLDVPAALQNVKTLDEKSSVKITWDAASNRGANGGAVLTSDVSYNVYRVRINEGVTNQQLLGNTATTTFSETVNTTEGEQEVRMYAAAAKNGKGEGEHVMSSAMIVGAPYTLPFQSNFVEEEGAPLWWSLTRDADNGIGFLQNTQTSSDGDNNCLTFTSYSANGTADISSGKIALNGAKNPTVTFSHSGVTGKNIVLDVYAQTPDGEQQLLGTVDYASLTGKAEDWHRTSFKIPATMAQQDYVILTFRATADVYGILRIDDVCVRNTYANDLSVSFNAPQEMKKGESKTTTITVTNNGEKDAKGYSVVLKAGSREVLNETVNETLKPLESKTFNVEVASSVNSKSTTLRLSANVDYAADENTADNTATYAVKLLESDVPMPDAFEAVKDEAANTLSMKWTAPAPASTRARETFENYDNWTINEFGDWTTYTSKKGSTTGSWWGAQGMPFPHETEPYVYIVFNPEAIQEGITSQNSSVKPHGGDKCLMSMWSRDGNTFLPTDDWLISPMLSGEAQTILFWANNPQPDMTNVRYPQSIEVLYSDKTRDHADFKTLCNYTQKGGAWESFTADIPEGANYFAIRCNTSDNDAYALLLDDIVYYAGYGKLQGFNVYRNDEVIETLPADATTYTVTYDPTAEPTRYSVSAVFVGGESAGATTDDCQTAITGVTIDAQHPADVYTVDGKLVLKNATSLGLLKSGVYVVNGVKVVK